MHMYTPSKKGVIFKNILYMCSFYEKNTAASNLNNWKDLSTKKKITRSE